jgi:hypothetical protein
MKAISFICQLHCPPQQTMDFNVSQTTSTKRKATVLQDIPQEDADPMLPIRDLFTFSPFGLCCRQCKNNSIIQRDERCISRHLKKHGMDSRVALVRSLLLAFDLQLKIAKASGSIESYRSDKNTYTGYS